MAMIPYGKPIVILSGGIWYFLSNILGVKDTSRGDFL